MNRILAKWNTLHPATAEQEVLPCCGSRTWATRLTAARPLADQEVLTRTSDRIWLSLPAADQLEAFATHPRLGERQANATPQSLAWSATEQATATFDSQAEQDLNEANHLYESRFHRTFILCATGKTTAEILTALHQRLTNTPEQELQEAAEQQRQITNLRLVKWLEGA